MATEPCLFTADDMPSTGRSRAHRILVTIEPVIELPALVRRGGDQPQAITWTGQPGDCGDCSSGAAP